MKKKIFFITLCILMFPILWKIFVFLKIDTCLDNRGVWDYDSQKCRHDCLKWHKDFGCIKLTEEETQTIQNCLSSVNCITNEMYRQICLRNQKVYNPDTNICKFDFIENECHKLVGNWIYPDICLIRHDTKRYKTIQKLAT